MHDYSLADNAEIAEECSKAALFRKCFILVVNIVLVARLRKSARSMGEQKQMHEDFLLLQKGMTKQNTIIFSMIYALFYSKVFIFASNAIIEVKISPSVEMNRYPNPC